MIKDKFVSNLIGFKSYISDKKILLTHLKKIQKPFFLTIKSKKKLIYKLSLRGLKIKLISKLVYFERCFKKKKVVRCVITYLSGSARHFLKSSLSLSVSSSKILIFWNHNRSAGIPDLASWFFEVQSLSWLCMTSMSFMTFRVIWWWHECFCIGICTLSFWRQKEIFGS